MHEIKSIGILHSPHRTIEDMPIQFKGASDIEGYILMHEKDTVGLQPFIVLCLIF